MRIKKESGFTLIETLVAINLSFIAVTMAIGFYLFILKLMTYSSNNVHVNQTDNHSLNIIQGILYKTHDFDIHLKSDSILINADKRIIIFSKDKISVNNIYIIKEYKLNSFRIFKADQVEISWEKEIDGNEFAEEKIGLSSNEIETFSFEFKKNNSHLSI